MSAQPDSRISRRDFLRRVGAGAAAVAAVGLVPGLSQAGSAAEPTGQPWGVLIDLTRCTGCNSCALACKEANNLPNDGSAPSALAGDAYTFVDERQVAAAAGRTVTRYVKRQCMHCLDASCVSACPAAAMHKGEKGAVVYRSERCLGCRYCQVACPFGLPRFDWENGIDPVISKCMMCYGRLQRGLEPACVSACPTGALRFGRRQQLLAQAHAQIASNPGRYVDHVFGEFEVGGTAMLYLSDTPFDQLGFPAGLPSTAPAQETEKIMSKLPHVIAGAAVLTAGTALYTHRKEEPQPQLGHEACGDAETTPAGRDDQEE